jgi:hypothetical protein
MILQNILEKITPLPVGDVADIPAREYGYAARSLALILRAELKKLNLKDSFIVSVQGDFVKVKRKCSTYSDSGIKVTKSVLSADPEPLPAQLPAQHSLSMSSIRTTNTAPEIVSALMVLVSRSVKDMAELVTSNSISSLPSPLDSVEYHQTPTGILIL